MDMVLLGNIVAFIGCMIMVYIGILKTKKGILAAQCVQCVFMGAGNFILGAGPGVISNVLNIVRNLVSFRWKFGVWHKAVFCLAQVVLTAIVNEHGIIGWLPVVAGVLFTCYMDKGEEKLKYVIIAGQVMWAVYDLVMKNYTGCFFDLLTLGTNLIGLYRVRKDLKKTSEA